MKSLNFSGMNPVDTNFIVTNFEKIKQRLPKNYFGTLKGYEYSNQQNDDAIWFMQIFAQVTERGQVKIYSAYKMTFEGTDPSALSFRENPLIKNIQFFFDKTQLEELQTSLVLLSKGAVH